MESTEQTQVKDYAADYIICKYPFLGAIISVLYLIIVKKILPKFMENRPGYNLKYILMVYNIFQVYINAQMVREALHPDVLRNYWKSHCVPIYPYTPYYHEVMSIAATYGYVKILDLLDTVFIILKKKSSQLSFLHLFHHSALVTVTFLAVSDRESIAFSVVIINSFVHTVMYFYYMLASLGASKWILSYKRRVTQIQIIQFVMILAFILYALVSRCPLGRKSAFTWCMVGLVLLYQFIKFYYSEYITKKRKQKS